MEIEFRKEKIRPPLCGVNSGENESVPVRETILGGANRRSSVDPFASSGELSRVICVVYTARCHTEELFYSIWDLTVTNL